MKYQGDEKQGPTTKATLPSKAIIKNQRRNKELTNKKKLKEFVNTKSKWQQMLKGLL